MADAPSNADIARALGVSPGRVSQLAAEGMPRHTLDEALNWYQRNVDPVRSLGQRLSREQPARPALRPAATGAAAIDDLADRLGEAGPQSAEDALLALVEMQALALEAVAADARAFERAALPLKFMMRMVPPPLRARVRIAEPVWRALTRPAVEAMRRHDPSIGGASAEMTAEEAAAVGAVLYALACGEMGVRS